MQVARQDDDVANRLSSIFVKKKPTNLGLQGNINTALI